MTTIKQVNQKIRNLLKPKKDFVVLGKKEYNEVLKQLEFYKGLKKA